MTETALSSFHRQLVKDPNGKLAAVRIESPSRVVLSADPASDDPDVLPISKGADLAVFADQIVLSGNLSLPGRTVVLFARVVSGAGAATLDVSGENGRDPPPALPAGPLDSAKHKVGVGQIGTPGSSNKIWPYPAEDAREVPGGKGWSADEHPNQMNGEPGSNGADGQDGGTIEIYCNRLAGELLTLRANGGNGGKGQKGQAGAKGGPGGPGADMQTQVGTLSLGYIAPTPGGPGGTGGHGGRGGRGGAAGRRGDVKVCALQPYSLATPPTVWCSNKGGNPGEGGDGGDAGPGGDGGHGGRLAGNYPQGVPRGLPGVPTGTPLDDDRVYQEIDSRCRVGGIQEGQHGQTGQPGDRGDPGHSNNPPITMEVIDGGGTWVSQTSGPDHQGLYHSWQVLQWPSVPVTEIAAQCSLRQLRTVMDAVLLDAAILGDRPQPAAEGDAAHAKPIDAAWGELFDRLKFINGLLTTLARGLDPTSLDGRLASQLAISAFALGRALLTGQNGFGKPSGFVPVGSLAKQLGRLKDATTNLEKIEELAEDYRQCVAANADAKATLLGADTHVNAAARYLTTETGTAADDLKKVQDELDAAEQRRKQSRDRLEPLLEKVKAEVKGSFQIDPAQLLNALSQLAFVNAEAPVQAGMMVAGAAGSVILDGTQNIITDSGAKIDKRYVVGQLRAFDSDKLGGELAAAGDGFKDDSASYRYLADLGKFMNLVQDFLSNPQVHSVVDLRDELLSQIELVQERNQLVDEYNAVLHRIAQLKAAAAAVDAERTKVRDELTANADPAAAEMATYLGGLVDRAKWEALRQLYMTMRAATFWQLDDSTLMADLLGADLRGRALSINSGAIGAAGSTLLGRINEALEQARPLPNGFPASEIPYLGRDGNRWLNAGVVIAITREKHPEFFADLETMGEATFTILPNVQGSTAPSGTDDLGPSVVFGDANGDADPVQAAVHPFYDKPNVRLTKVRVFLDEPPDVTGHRVLHLVHSGDERFVRSDGDVFPATGDLSHREVTVKNAYTVNGFGFNPLYGFAASALEGVDTEDGDLQFPAGNAALPNSDYAPIGPVTVWRLVVNPDGVNHGLDLEKVNRVFVDFHGFHA